MFNTMGVMDAIDPAMFRRRRQQPLAYLRAQLTDALLPGIWSRDGVRLSSAGTVAGVDDARCSTSTGRLLVPRNAGSYVDLGDQSATLGGLTKLTILARLTPQDIAATRAIVGTTESSPCVFDLDWSTAGNFRFSRYNGTTLLSAALNTTTINPGTEYVVTVVFDGTQVVTSNRVQMGVASVVGGTPGAITLTALGNAADASALVSDGTHLVIGGDNLGGRPAAAPIDGVALYIGQALTAAQINAEVASGYSGAHHRYQFNGTLNDSGTVGGWNGSAVGTGLAYCSDDTRWGPILYSGGGTANPTWDAVNREAVFDGVSQYVRAVGGAIAAAASFAKGGMVAVGTQPTSGYFCDLAINSGTTLVRMLQSSTNIIGVVPGITTSATATIAAVTGTCATFARRESTLPTAGIQVGAGSEATGTGTGGATTTANRFTFGADRADVAAEFGNPRFRGCFLYAGDFAGKQPIAYPWAQSLGAQL